MKKKKWIFKQSAAPTLATLAGAANGQSWDQSIPLKLGHASLVQNVNKKTLEKYGKNMHSRAPML